MKRYLLWDLKANKPFEYSDGFAQDYTHNILTVDEEGANDALAEIYSEENPVCVVEIEVPDNPDGIPATPASAETGF